jgi:hypothetical protein
VTGIEIGLVWIAFSIALPIVFGLRYAKFKDYRHRLEVARAHFHRFRLDHKSKRIAR